MVTWPTAIFSLLVGAAGWYYIFYSRAAHRLAAVEGNQTNRLRVVLRQVNGIAMILLAALLYAGTHAVDSEHEPRAFAITWLALMAVLLIVVTLGLIDVRLTVKLRQRQRLQKRAGPVDDGGPM